MKSWIRSVAAAIGTLWLLGAVQAAPPPQGDPQLPPSKMPRERFPRPMPEEPPPPRLIPRICNTGPAPQVTLEVKKVYVGLKWAAVPNARTYWIWRNVVGTTATADNLTTSDPFLETEYWDAVPDPRYDYEYTITAVQPDGCTGSAKATVNGPYALPHPTGTSGGHPTPNQIILNWSEQWGATGYRIDGPGIPNTGLYLPGTTFIQGKKPLFAGTPGSGSYGGERIHNMSAAVAGQGVARSEFRIFALYPNAADYSRSNLIYVQRVPPIITSISPTSGTIGQTVVTIRGQYLTDPGDSQTHKTAVVFGAPANQYASGGTTANVRSRSSTEITAVASASGLVRVATYQQLATGGGTPSGSALSQQSFAGMQAPPPPPSPPPQVRVPGVVGLSFNGALQVLQNAGFVPLAGTGPTGPGTIVQTQQPQGGAMAPQGSAVTVNTVALAGGFSEITLYNNMQQQRSVNAWLFDMAAGSWTDNASIAFGATTRFDLLSGRTYFILVLDPTKCGGQNNPANAACEYWRLPGVPGDENGPKTTVPIN